jgi:hypothetical protein
MAKQHIADIDARAASGVAHPIRVETTDKGAALPAGWVATMVTVMGADGVKRHASSQLDAVADIDALIAALSVARDAMIASHGEV